MDDAVIKTILGFAVGNVALLLGIIFKIWSFARKHTIMEYQHTLMWNRFQRNYLQDVKEYEE